MSLRTRFRDSTLHESIPYQVNRHSLESWPRPGSFASCFSWWVWEYPNAFHVKTEGKCLRLNCTFCRKGLMYTAEIVDVKPRWSFICRYYEESKQSRCLTKWRMRLCSSAVQCNNTRLTKRLIILKSMSNPSTLIEASITCSLKRGLHEGMLLQQCGCMKRSPVKREELAVL